MTTRFPPSFDDSPMSYGFALFSMALIVSISMTIVINYAVEASREREINRLVKNQAYPPSRHGVTLLNLHRLVVGGFLMTIIFGALPDVLVLLAWGEASDATMQVLFDIDRLFDGLTLVPYLFSISIMIRSAGSVDHLLGRDPIKIDLRPTWGMVRDKLKIAGAVLCIAVGVTFYKAAGWQ